MIYTCYTLYPYTHDILLINSRYTVDIHLKYTWNTWYTWSIDALEYTLWTNYSLFGINLYNLQISRKQDGLFLSQTPFFFIWLSNKGEGWIVKDGGCRLKVHTNSLLVALSCLKGCDNICNLLKQHICDICRLWKCK